MTYHVLHNGIPQFTADTVHVTGNNTFDFLDNGPPPPPAGRYTFGRVHYPPRETTGNTVDLTLWENLFGRVATGGDAVPFPGLSGSTPIVNSLPVGDYIAAKFVVPNLDVQGQYKIPPEWGTDNVDMSISINPGDFDPTTALGVVLGPVRFNATYLQYTTRDTTSRIKLAKLGTYYFNIRRHSAGNMVVAAVHQGGVAV